MLQMRDLTQDEKKRVSQAFTKALFMPGMSIGLVGVLHNVLVGRHSHGALIPIIVIVLTVGGMTTGMIMGFSARRREINAVEAERQQPRG